MTLPDAYRDNPVLAAVHLAGLAIVICLALAVRSHLKTDGSPLRPLATAFLIVFLCLYSPLLFNLLQKRTAETVAPLAPIFPGALGALLFARDDMLMQGAGLILSAILLIGLSLLGTLDKANRSFAYVFAAAVGCTSCLLWAVVLSA